MTPTRLIAACAAVLLASCAPASSVQEAVPPPTKVQSFVIAANPLAAKAGLDVLEQGGSAIDAAIAVQAMLSLVEPQSSGIGGGTIMQHLDGATGKLEVYDGRERAPAQASQTMFLGPDGRPLGFAQAVVSGRATGVPGVVAALSLAHKEHGSLPWRNLFGAAIRTADDGFVISPRLGRFLPQPFPQLESADAKRYFSKPDGTRLATGDLLRNPEYAEFLRRLARDGADALYRGSTAAKIVARTRQAPLEGAMTMTDLAEYRPTKRVPICALYRSYKVCAPPPPSSGVGMLALLGLLERTDIAKRGPDDPQAWFLFAEASRLMYADRDSYVGDADFVKVPVAGMIDPAYLDQRAALIGASAATAVEPGKPAGAGVAVTDRTLEPAGTSHFVVRDSRGNVVSMTTTVESIFGSGRMVDGFFLNNQMTDFSFDPFMVDGAPSPNAVAPRKRPRSSMVPLILFDRDGRFAGAIGSAGGNAILAYVGKCLVGAIDWNLPMQQALALPNLVARGANFNGEVTKFRPELLAALAARGVILKPGQGEDSGVHGVLIRDGRVDGGYDPRREGVVLLGP
jgi:gamma-glutamyltranspeptidase / glutathione hydrolase